MKKLKEFRIVVREVSFATYVVKAASKKAAEEMYRNGDDLGERAGDEMDGSTLVSVTEVKP